MSFSPLWATFFPLERTEKESELGDISVKPTSKPNVFIRG
jgi:hypothetical protein